MCDPFSIGLALVVAGGGAKFFGEKKAQKASERTANRERQRQKAFEAEQVARFDDSLNATEQLTDPRAMAAAASAREGSLASVIASSAPNAGGYLPGSSSAPAIVGDANAKAGAASDARSSELARALGVLGGTTDALQKTDIQIGRNSGEIAQIGGFKRGSLNVLDAELRAAAQKGAMLRGLGGLAQQIGGAAMGMPGGVGGAGPIGVLSQGSLATAPVSMSSLLPGMVI